MANLPFLALLATVAAAPARPPDNDDLLRRLIDKSDLVVAGTIADGPSVTEDESGVLSYVFLFDVAEVFKGGTTGESGLTDDMRRFEVNIKRFELKLQGRHPLLEKGSTCILFLRKASEGERPRWRSSDFWFAAQPESHALAKAVKRLVGAEPRDDDELSSPPAEPTDNNDLLCRLIAKSELVVAGTVVTAPVVREEEARGVTYRFRFGVAKVLKGDKGGEAELMVHVSRFELIRQDRHPELKKGGKCILFLTPARRSDVPSWQSTDGWFGVQQDDYTMAADIKKIAGNDDQEKDDDPK